MREPAGSVRLCRPGWDAGKGREPRAQAALPAAATALPGRAGVLSAAALLVGILPLARDAVYFWGRRAGLQRLPPAPPSTPEVASISARAPGLGCVESGQPGGGSRPSCFRRRHLAFLSLELPGSFLSFSFRQTFFVLFWQTRILYLFYRK